MRRPVTTLLLLCALTFFLGLGDSAITDSDEAFYAEASREMVESGDWLTPRFNYEDRWQKPVLYYWLTATTFLVTGPTEWSARAWSAFAGVGLVMLTWSTGRTMTGDARVGWLSGAIAATCFGCFAMARAALPDLPLAFCITLAIWAAIQAAEHGTPWWVLSGFIGGLGLLLKGPVAIVIPAIVLLPTAWRERTRLVIAPTGVLLGAAVCAVVALPWYVAMLAEHGTAYAHSFFIGDNFERFATERFNDPRPVWFYLPVVIGGMLPWSAYLVAVSVQPLKEALRRRRQFADEQWRLFLWALMPVLFYTLSIGKQPRYILPVLPPIAILLAWDLVGRTSGEGSTSSPRQPALLVASWATLLLFGLAALLLSRMQPLLIGTTPAVLWTSVTGTVIAAAAIATVVIRRKWSALPMVLVVSSVVLVLTIQFTVLSRSRPEPVEVMADLVQVHQRPDDRLGVYRAFVRNLAFYTHRRHEDLFDEATALDFLRSPGRVLLVLPEKDLPALQAASGTVLRPLGEVTYVNTANIRLRTLLNPDPSTEITRVLLVANR